MRHTGTPDGKISCCEMHASANPIALNAAKGLLQWREMRVVTSSLTVFDGFAKRSGDDEGSRPAFYAGAQGQNSRFAPAAGSEPAFRARGRVRTRVSRTRPGQNSRFAHAEDTSIRSSRSQLAFRTSGRVRTRKTCIPKRQEAAHPRGASSAGANRGAPRPKGMKRTRPQATPSEMKRTRPQSSPIPGSAR